MEIYIPLDILSDMYAIKTGYLGIDLDNPLTASFDEDTEAEFSSSLELMERQNKFLRQATEAAYCSLNDMDKENRFGAELYIRRLVDDVDFSLSIDSNSVGLGYSIALALEWRKQLGKNDDIAFNIIATGAVNDIGKVTSIEDLSTKIEASLKLMSEPFIFFYPKDDVTPEILEQISQAKESLKGNKGIECEYIGIKYLYEALGHKHLLDDAYDGKPIERSLEFKGYSSFEPEDATRFFGRNNLKRKLKERYEHSNNLIVAYGPSGVGKSSLVKAGLFFDLKRDNREKNLQIKTSELKSENCIPTLLSELFEFIGGEVVGDKVANESNIIKCLESSSEDVKYLWYIDQFEQIFTQIDVDVLQAKEFVEFLNSLVEKHSAMLKIIVTVRTEYKKYFSDELLFEVTDVEQDDLEEILTKQAKSLGLEFQKDSQADLKREIKNELKGLDFPLPALQFLLLKLQKNSKGKVLLYEEYQKLGGVKGAFATEVEKILDNGFGASDLFFELFVGCDNEQNLYARKVKVALAIKTAKGMKDIIEELIKEKMVVYTTDSKTEVRLIHDSLIKVNSDYRWGLFEAWYKEHIEYLDWFNGIEKKFNNWLEEKTLAANDK